jgi:hypothetical protein
MSNAALHKLSWALIYGGLLALVLGLSIQKADDALGWPMVLGGALVAGVGALLIVVRSRRKDLP